MTLSAIAHRMLWAKADTRSTDVHRLLYHLIDVGCAAQVLWTAISPSVRRDLAAWLQCDETTTGQLVVYWAALHDLGKASPAFQNHRSLPEERRKAILAMLQEQGLPVTPGAEQSPPRHEVITTWVLQQELKLQTLPGLSHIVALVVGRALGGHHGFWPNSERLEAVKAYHCGNTAWMQVRFALVYELASLFQPPPVPPLQRRSYDDNVAMTLFSGFVTIADWIASNSDLFPYQNDHLIDVRDYQQHSLRLAHDALHHIGWHTQPALSVYDFKAAFGFDRNEVQSAIRQHLVDCIGPTFAIIEAPMGIGKTEAVLDIFGSWSQSQDIAGLYVAMPTMATSNQMHQRVASFLHTVIDPSITPLLVHSAASLQPTDLQSQGVAAPVEEQAGEYTSNLTWFLPGKKNLLVPFGVGTVDQVLLGVLQSKHSFLRLFGLSHKVLVFDEVHAYDSYMSELFKRLLHWLRALHCSVIILSATLPHATRQQLVTAYGGQLASQSAAAYPRVTWVQHDGITEEQHLPAPAPQSLAYAWVEQTDTAIAECLRDQLQHGGCATVICNTVARAQHLFSYLSTADLVDSPDDLWLFHARTPFHWRQQTERRVLERFGPGEDKRQRNPLRPDPARRVILVATQVIEQSLDLDFDVMISELAPIDLLLQRAGRLLRHRVNDPLRRMASRCLWIAVNQGHGLPVLDPRNQRVYHAYVLYRTWLALSQRPNATVMIPTDMQDLIDLVYSDQPFPSLTPEQQDRCMEAAKQMARTEGDARRHAQQFLVKLPQNPWYLHNQAFCLVEDDPTVHHSLRALTRSGTPGIKAVCLHRRDGQLWLDADDEKAEERCEQACEPQMAPKPDLIRELARRTISIDRDDLQKAVLTQDSAEVRGLLDQWQRIPALRFSHVLVFEQGLCKFDGFLLRLDRTLGLQVERATR